MVHFGNYKFLIKLYVKLIKRKFFYNCLKKNPSFSNHVNKLSDHIKQIFINQILINHVVFSSLLGSPPRALARATIL